MFANLRKHLKCSQNRVDFAGKQLISISLGTDGMTKVTEFNIQILEQFKF